MKQYKHVFNLEYYDLKLWEKIILFFCRMKIFLTPKMFVWFKEFHNRLYIYTRAYVVDKQDYDTTELDDKHLEN